jgi:hypothetical protein
VSEVGSQSFYHSVILLRQPLNHKGTKALSFTKTSALINSSLFELLCPAGRDEINQQSFTNKDQDLVFLCVLMAKLKCDIRKEIKILCVSLSRKAG